MKKIFIFIFSLMIVNSSYSQIWKRIQKKAENSIVKKVGKDIDKTINGTKKEGRQKKQKKGKEENKHPEKVGNDKSLTIWRKYKFIPGEKVIFYDDLKFEETGEFPSRWDLKKGGAEIALFNNEKVIIPTAKYQNYITPLFEDKNYLSDEFTIEFDVYADNLTKNNYRDWANYNIIFGHNVRNYEHTSMIKIRLQKDKLKGEAFNHNFKLEEVEIGALHAWHHIALSYHKGKLKVYFDNKRVLNLPNIKIKPTNFYIDINGHQHPDIKVALKNIRVAHGGGQMYKRIMADGKYVTNGILFDSGKATIKQQSMGVINKVVNVMKEKPDWKFQIVGHTDSDGTVENNLDLSLKRAKSVKQSIVSQGIKAERLTTVGKGESEPLNSNGTIEEKANNRRVEFILKGSSLE